MYVRTGRPPFAQPYVGVLRSTSLINSSLFLQQCPACLLRLTWIVFMMGGWWPYSWCFVRCCLQDLFNIAIYIYIYIYIYIVPRQDKKDATQGLSAEFKRFEFYVQFLFFFFLVRVLLLEIQLASFRSNHVLFVITILFPTAPFFSLSHAILDKQVWKRNEPSLSSQLWVK